MQKIIITILLLFSIQFIFAQNFYLGADLSYVNEMEDCGVTYQEDGNTKNVHTIFSDSGCNLVRLRLWHTPSWYDDLNTGKRYSDLADVKIAINRAKQNGMNVLLDFHLSDSWADPSSQLVPTAWLPVVDDINILKDSLYNYIFSTLTELHSENLLPEMIQIGNETNKGILLSPQDNQVWTLDWNRNATLFNRAIQAVRDFEDQNNENVKIVIHVADPSNAEWLVDGFISNGVTDFDIIGLSYYWAWHMPTTIADAGNVIQTLRNFYPDKEVLIVETGYIWTTAWNDNAANIISETHPDYTPASPENQRDWLIDLTKEVIAKNGLGVIYWEPAWVSSPCFTQWGQGSHQEHAAFFDFDNNLLIPGGIEWMSYNYDILSDTKDLAPDAIVQIMTNSFSGDVKIRQLNGNTFNVEYIVTDASGKVIVKNQTRQNTISFQLNSAPFGVYIVVVKIDGQLISKQFVFSDK
ncbi:MAG: glycosyl hydrolase 53 family protein [Bacteroidota bacterium]